jgi:MFS family permease
VLSFVLKDSEPVTSQRPRITEPLKSIVKNSKIMTTNMVEACQYFAFGGFETFLPLYARSVGVTTAHIGLIFSIQLVVTLATKPTMGKLSDAVGRTPVIVFGLVLGAGSLLVIPYVHTFLLLTAAVAGFGLALASVTASTSALVSDLCKGSYGSALGVLSMIMDVGHASGPVVTGVFIALFSYRAAFSVLAVLLLAAGLIFSVVVVRDSPER